ncbi:hypothetical protein AgCh_001266 [Apium graveolens]
MAASRRNQEKAAFPFWCKQGREDTDPIAIYHWSVSTSPVINPLDASADSGSNIDSSDESNKGRDLRTPIAPPLTSLSMQERRCRPRRSQSSGGEEALGRKEARNDGLEDCKPVYTDLEYNAKLSNFGLAKDGPEQGRTHVSERVMGTSSYLAPEYAATGYYSTKSIVERAWAKCYLTSKHGVLYVMDVHIQGQYTVRAALRAASLALKCLSVHPKSRPDASQPLQRSSGFLALWRSKHPDAMLFSEMAHGLHEPVVMIVANTQVLKNICCYVDDILRDLMVASICKASLVGYIWVLMNGGPSCAFSDADVKLMDEDLHILEVRVLCARNNYDDESPLKDSGLKPPMMADFIRTTSFQWSNNGHDTRPRTCHFIC